MRFPPLSILSVGAALGFACTGEDGGSDPNARESGGETGIGGASSGGSSNGGGPSTGGSGISGSSGNANGGNGASGGDGETGGAAGSDGGAAGESGAGGAGGEGGAAPPSILLFSRTTGFRHESIPDAVSALVQIAAEHDWLYRYTEDPTIFSDEGLSPFSVVVFALTSGDVLDGNQEAAFERFVRAGGGFVGIHSASDTEYDWPFYGGLVGAYFREHPAIQEAALRVEGPAHPATAELPASFLRTDEWYAFQENPRPNVTVLLTLDEASYAPGTATMAGGDHPVAWFHEYVGGRAFYTALGHTRESYADPLFLSHLTGALSWAARL